MQERGNDKTARIGIDFFCAFCALLRLLFFRFVWLLWSAEAYGYQLGTVSLVQSARMLPVQTTPTLLVPLQAI